MDESIGISDLSKESKGHFHSDSRIDDEMGTSDVGACALMKLAAAAAAENGRSLDRRRSPAPRSLLALSFLFFRRNRGK